MTRLSRSAFALALLCTTAMAVEAAANGVEVERIETTYRFQEDGTGVITVHAKWKALTQAGVTTITQFSVPFASDLEDLHVSYFRTIKKDGQTLEGDPKQIFDAAMPAAAAAPVFTGNKVKQFVLPNVEPGDSIEYQFVKNVKSQKAGEFWEYHIPIPNMVVRAESVTLDLPANRKVALHFDPKLPHTSNKSGTRQLEKWDFDNTAVQQEEEPVQPTFAVSTILSWESLGEWLRSLMTRAQR